MSTSTESRGDYLAVRGLCKRFGKVQAADHVGFPLGKGHILALLGPSGCGKTTTLRAIAGLTRPDAGSIRIDGTEVTKLPTEKRSIGMVFQTWALFPHMTIYENIAFALKSRRVPRTEVAGRVKDALDLVKLSEMENRTPSQLSGGQQQRIALTRALATQPKLMLFDEPLSNLDHQLRSEMRTELKRLQLDLGLTGVYVTHDQGEALSLGDEVAVMCDGKILDRRRAKELFESPSSRFVAAFMGVSNILEGSVSPSGEAILISNQDGGSLRLPSAREPGSRVSVGLRPERVKLLPREQSSDLWDTHPVVVRGVDYLGSQVSYVVDLVDLSATLRVLETGSAVHSINSELLVGWNREDVMSLEVD